MLLYLLKCFAVLLLVLLQFHFRRTTRSFAKWAPLTSGANHFYTQNALSVFGKYNKSLLR